MCIQRVLYGEYGAINVSCMCTTIRDAVMPYTSEFTDLAQSIADRKRAEWREGNTSQPPALENAIEDLNAEMDPAEKGGKA